MLQHIDINCDLGEGARNDAKLMHYISSCNIACGGHFGDRESMINAIRLAKKNNVKIGAHPSYPDYKNFGRQVMKIEDNELKHSIYNQIMNFKSICDEENAELNHIKLHGALYNLASSSSAMATLIFEALIKTNIKCKLYTPYQSELAKIKQNQFEICREAFIDRSYHSDLSLVNRMDKNAIISSPKMAWRQLYYFIKHQEVVSIDGKRITISADTFCIHGDHEMAIEIMEYINDQLYQNDLIIK
ncbi:MAG: 5-oxoprolinase subunit PxpA [Crocinitomicaceae bacterium]